MLEFGKSYVVTLTAAAIMPDGSSRWAVHGDYKGEAKLCDNTYVMFGDFWLKESSIQFIARADHANIKEVECIHVSPDGEIVRYMDKSNIGRAHMANG